MPASAVLSAAPSSRDLAWRVIGLVNLYRLLVPPTLLAIHIFGGEHVAVSASQPRLFVYACIAYFCAGVLLVLIRRLAWPSIRHVTLINIAVDTVAISLILYTVGGVASGLGILLVLPVGATAVLSDGRDGFLIAAAAALGILIQQIFS
ncbi:MAG TPA: hypothetical protein VIL32_11170, partial [Steroidobacteraceae bacterium]